MLTNTLNFIILHFLFLKEKNLNYLNDGLGHVGAKCSKHN